MSNETHQNDNELSTTRIHLAAQHGGWDSLNSYMKSPWISTPLVQQLSDPEKMYAFLLGFICSAFVEYHQQLRLALLEKGIELDGFVETPLIPTDERFSNWPNISK